jgi:hypothetical protein
LQYIFEWGDGEQTSSPFLPLPRGTAFSSIHKWDEPGEYELKVTVTDGDLESESEITIQVVEPVLATNIAIIILAGIIITAFLIVLYYKKRK